jgi:hypothetical protein
MLTQEKRTVNFSHVIEAQMIKKLYYRTKCTLKRDVDNLIRAANVLSCTHSDHKIVD